MGIRSTQLVHQSHPYLKFFCDLTNGYSDNNIDIDAMLASELEKYPNVSAMAQNYLNLT